MAYSQSAIQLKSNMARIITPHEIPACKIIPWIFWPARQLLLNNFPLDNCPSDNKLSGNSLQGNYPPDFSPDAITPE